MLCRFGTRISLCAPPESGSKNRPGYDIITEMFVQHDTRSSNANSPENSQRMKVIKRSHKPRRSAVPTGKTTVIFFVRTLTFCSYF